MSIIYSFLSRFCRCCFHCADDCEINLACTGKVVRLCVKSQKWPSESADLHFICLIMQPNRHFIMRHTQSNKLALLDFNKTCDNRSNHYSSWVKAHADCIRTTIILLLNNHVHLFSRVHCHPYALLHGRISVSSLQSICAINEWRSTIIQMNVAHLRPQLLKIN